MAEFRIFYLFIYDRRRCVWKLYFCGYRRTFFFLLPRILSSLLWVLEWSAFFMFSMFILCILYCTIVWAMWMRVCRVQCTQYVHVRGWRVIRICVCMYILDLRTFIICTKGYSTQQYVYMHRKRSRMSRKIRLVDVVYFLFFEFIADCKED